MERRRREETLSKRQRMVATCKEKGCELKTEMDEEGKSHTNITAIFSYLHTVFDSIT